MEDLKLEWIAIALGVFVLALGLAKGWQVWSKKSEWPTGFFALLTILVGGVLMCFGGIGIVDAESRDAASPPNGTRFADFTAMSSLTGQELRIEVLYLYRAEDLDNSLRVPLAPRDRTQPFRKFSLKPGVSYIVNAEVVQKGFGGEWAAVESPDWRHFDLILTSGAQRINLQKVAQYVPDGIPENPKGRFLLFTF